MALDKQHQEILDRWKPNAMDRLIEAIERTKNPTVMGLDTRLEYLPEDMQNGAYSLKRAAKRILAYNIELLDGLADIVPAVKIQAAYYEMYGAPGFKAMIKTAQEAADRGYVVMIDGKRNDIGATAAAYADAYLGRTPLHGDEAHAHAVAADFLTVNPYLGIDGVQPFLDACRDFGAGLFVLVKTSNPSSGQLQDLHVGERTLYETVGDLVAAWGETLIGARGYSAVGAVVGATYPEQGRALRARLPHTFFLVPGYGAQGATARDLRGCFDKDGGGAIVNASRSLLCAWKKAGTGDFVSAARAEALRMRDEIQGAIREPGDRSGDAEGGAR